MFEMQELVKALGAISETGQTCFMWWMAYKAVIGLGGLFCAVWGMWLLYKMLRPLLGDLEKM